MTFETMGDIEDLRDHKRTKVSWRAKLISAFAISLAMALTWWEKTSVTARYKQVEDLR